MRLEVVVLVDSHPGEILPLAGYLVASTGQLLLGNEQVDPSAIPLVFLSCEQSSRA
jgi:hypothetical protein